MLNTEEMGKSIKELRIEESALMSLPASLIRVLFSSFYLLFV